MTTTSVTIVTLSTVVVKAPEARVSPTTAIAEEGERPRAAIYEHTPTSFRGSPYSKS